MKLNASKYNKHLQDRSLNELGKFQRGRSRHRPRNDDSLFKNGTYPLVQTGEIREANLYIINNKAFYNEFGLSQSKLWPKDTLCITIAANIAETALLSYPTCFPDSVVGFNANPDESSELFMHYVFTYIRRSIQNSVSGSIQDNINIDYLTNIKFKIPKKNYQDKITKILSSIDKKIELNNQINSELEKMAKTIYDYWFVQFDFPDKNGKPYKSSGGKMVWNEELKQDIPEGWKVKTIGSFSEIKRGTLVTEKTANTEGSIKVISAGVDHSYMHSISNRDKNTITISGSGANAGFINFWREPIFACDCTAIRGISDSVTLVLLGFLNIRQKYIMGQARGSAQPHVYPKDVSGLKMALPQNDLITKYGNLVIPGNDRISSNLYENQKLKNLRDWLLPMLMNGQVKVL